MLGGLRAVGELEVRKELTLGYDALGLISVGKALEMSGASRMEFEWWLGEREIVRPFSEEDPRHELESNGGHLGRLQAR
jgi:predicted HTH domain antitoxin